jgi:hypothetical protein
MYVFSDWSPAGKCTGRRSVTVDSTATGRVRLLSSMLEASCSNTVEPGQPTESTEVFIAGATGQELISRSAAPTQASASYEWNPAMLVLPNRADVYQAFHSSGSVNEDAGNEVHALSYQATLKLVGIDKLVVPAGTFPLAVHLQLVETRAYPGPLATQLELRTDRWLARSIGVLKTKVEVVVNGKVTQSTQLQLACSSLTDVQSVRCVLHEPGESGK